MDDLDKDQLKLLKHGGNRRFLEYIKLYEIINNESDRDMKYLTKACEMYRKLL